MAKKVFESKASFNRSLNSVYKFHEKCFETILKYLQENGDIELDEEERDEWCFCFLDVEGYYKISAIRITEDGNGFYLDSGGTHFYWDDINHDMIITEMLMDKVL